MEISDERVDELRRLYKQVYGEDITIAEAREMGQRLLTLYQLLMRPLSDGSENPP